MTGRILGSAALSGLLLAAAFPAVDLHFLAWFGMVPLLLALRGLTPKQAFWTGAVFGTVFFGSTIYWVTNSVHFYGHVPLVPASLITLLLCAYCALYLALFSAIVARLRMTRPALLFLAAPAVWTALELARTYIFSGFPWSLLGYSQYSVLPVVQIADITGVYGISFLIVLVNASLTVFIEDRKQIMPLAVAAAVLVIVLGYGYNRLGIDEAPEQVRIAVIQGNIEQDKKWDAAYQDEVFATYERLTARALEQGADLVVWPETATPFYFGGDGKLDALYTDQLREFVRSMETPLLTGSPTYEKRGQKYILRNSAFLITADGAIGAAYHKMHLVPFGEYVPLKSVLFFVEKMVQAIGDFQGGAEHTVMTVSADGSGPVRIGTVICYEIIFPDLVRQFVKEGASVMTTVTNDAWFGRTAAPYQHFSMAVLRAVENRVPIARAANTGVSGFIDSRGRVLETSGVFREAVLVRALSPGTERTFYTRYGDVFAFLCIPASFVLILLRPQHAAGSNARKGQ